MQNRVVVTEVFGRATGDSAVDRLNGNESLRHGDDLHEATARGSIRYGRGVVDFSQ